MKKSVILFSVAASSLLLIFAFYVPTAINITSSSWAQEVQEQEEHLKNLNLLRNIGSSTEREAKITSTEEMREAIIHGLDGTEIPDYLTTNFDRMYTMILHYLNLEDRGERMVNWVMDFDALQEMPAEKESCLGGCPTALAALYVPAFDYCFFVPRHANDYYITHELLHHFIDEYEEEVVEGLPEVITKQNRTGLPLRDFLKQNEEEIVINLSQIIVQKSLAGFVLGKSRCTCMPETKLQMPGLVSCTCIEISAQMIANKDIDCKECHGTDEIGKFVSQKPSSP